MCAAGHVEFFKPFYKQHKKQTQSFCCSIGSECFSLHYKLKLSVDLTLTLEGFETIKEKDGSMSIFCYQYLSITFVDDT